MKNNNSLGVVCILLRYLGETIVKVILFLITCAVLIGLGIYIGYSVDLGIKFDLVDKYPAIVVGGVAAAMALLGVFISQVGQYSVAKLNINKEAEKAKKQAEKAFFIELYLLKIKLKKLIIAEKNSSCDFCNFTYMYLNIREVDDEDIENEETDDEVVMQLLHITKDDRDNSVNLLRIVKDEYHESMAIIDYYCSYVDTSFNEDYEKYKTFESSIMEQIASMKKITSDISAEYNKYIGQPIPYIFKEKYPSPYQNIIDISRKTLADVDSSFDPIYNNFSRHRSKKTK